MCRLDDIVSDRTIRVLNGQACLPFDGSRAVDAEAMAYLLSKLSPESPAVVIWIGDEKSGDRIVLTRVEGVGLLAEAFVNSVPLPIECDCEEVVRRLPVLMRRSAWLTASELASLDWDLVHFGTDAYVFARRWASVTFGPPAVAVCMAMLRAYGVSRCHEWSTSQVDSDMVLGESLSTIPLSSRDPALKSKTCAEADLRTMAAWPV